MKFGSSVFCLAVLGIGAGIGLAWTAKAATLLLPFQGLITDAQGQVVADGEGVVQFKLYNAPVGGQAVWNGEVQKLSVNRGLMSTQLGSKATLGGMDFNRDLYLEVSIDANKDGQITLADPPLLPRQAILPAVFALESGNTSKLAGEDWTSLFGTNNPAGTLFPAKIADGSLPAAKLRPTSVTAAQLAPMTINASVIASRAITADQIADATIVAGKLSAELVLDSVIPQVIIVAFGGGDAPSGWLLCDGSALDKDQPEYARLYAAIQGIGGNGTESAIGAHSPTILARLKQSDFNIPDLRGCFLRGVNGPRNDSYADPDKLSRANRLTGGNSENLVGSLQPDLVGSHQHARRQSVFPAGSHPAVSSYVPVQTSDFHTEVMGGRKTRPENSYVNYIIKN